MSRLDIQKTYKLYIGGKFPRTESGRYYAVTNTKDYIAIYKGGQSSNSRG